MWKRETKFKVDQHSKRKDSVSFNNWTQGFPSIITSNKKLYFLTKMLDYLLKKEKKERRLWRNSHYHTNTHRDTYGPGRWESHHYLHLLHSSKKKSKFPKDISMASPPPPLSLSICRGKKWSKCKSSIGRRVSTNKRQISVIKM